MRPLIDRIHAKISPPNDDGCELWTGYFREQTGECRVQEVEGVTIDARRRWFEYYRYELGGAMLRRCVVHRRCVNPDHQRPGAPRPALLGTRRKRLPRIRTGWEHLHGGDAWHFERPWLAWKIAA